MTFKNLKEKIREPKVLRLLPNVCDFQKENHTLPYLDLKIYKKNLKTPSLWIFYLCDFHLRVSLSVKSASRRDREYSMEQKPQVFC
jgi:hypothetical protein